MILVTGDLSPARRCVRRVVSQLLCGVLLNQRGHGGLYLFD
ncbi:hypothetical protein ES332_A09G097900v1 [Gossypium tomentosum]|uniref:Uncharacterized protein n=1 Tax=Gossypium tomentosum TaxID=34277 RepID=A0A5D2P5F2_GOSTO|nr:hypothetical protein ES332_A09G097900v1 [Gossypium tomentosum]